MGRLQNKIALVTGAAQGLGKAIANEFAKEGAKVVLIDINEEGLFKVGKEIHEHGGEVLPMKLDVTNEEQWKVVINNILEKYGQLDVVVNNAGVGTHGNIETTTYESWKRVLNINLDSVFLGTKYGAEAMMKKGNGGSIINISSTEGIVGNPDLLAYSASKGGVKLMTKSAALHLAKKNTNIRVNTIHPGYINTELMKLVPNQDEVSSLVPQGIIADPSVIGQAAVYLASDESTYTTGSELVVDGGLTAQ